MLRLFKREFYIVSAHHPENVVIKQTQEQFFAVNSISKLDETINMKVERMQIDNKMNYLYSRASNSLHFKKLSHNYKFNKKLLRIEEFLFLFEFIFMSIKILLNWSLLEWVWSFRDKFSYNYLFTFVREISKLCISKLQAN